MANKTKPDPFVRMLLTALAKATKGTPPPKWISVDDLRLTQKPEHVDSTIERAVKRGFRKPRDGQNGPRLAGHSDP
jgi:hypothetical protein